MHKIAIKGKVEKSVFANGKNHVVIVTPAADEYSHPSKFKVSTTENLQVGSEYALQLELKSFVRTKSYRDKETGQQKEFDESTVYFDVIECQIANNSKPKAVSA